MDGAGGGQTEALGARGLTRHRGASPSGIPGALGPTRQPGWCPGLWRTLQSPELGQRGAGLSRTPGAPAGRGPRTAPGVARVSAGTEAGGVGPSALPEGLLWSRPSGPPLKSKLPIPDGPSRILQGRQGTEPGGEWSGWGRGTAAAGGLRFRGAPHPPPARPPPSETCGSGAQGRPAPRPTSPPPARPRTRSPSTHPFPGAALHSSS